jgi:hypothetical protein
MLFKLRRAVAFVLLTSTRQAEAGRARLVGGERFELPTLSV